MKLASLALASTVLGAIGVAHADRSLSIDSSVTSVVYDAGTRTRAVAGEDDGAYLVIERITQRGGGSDQVWIDTLPLGRNRVPLTELKNVRLVSLENNTLRFEASPRVRGGGKTVIVCTANLQFGRGRVDVTKASCTSGGQAYVVESGGQAGPPPPPPEPSLSNQDLQALSNVCDKTFSFDSERKKCLDIAIEATRTSNFPASTSRVVTACSSAFSFSSSRTKCMQTAFTSLREPAELISWCAGKFSFESERQSCLAKFAAMR